MHDLTECDNGEASHLLPVILNFDPLAVTIRKASTEILGALRPNQLWLNQGFPVYSRVAEPPRSITSLPIPKVILSRLTSMACARYEDSDSLGMGSLIEKVHHVSQREERPRKKSKTENGEFEIEKDKRVSFVNGESETKMKRLKNI